jgi:tetratricopeptide (TPR) repeat protein
VHVARTRRGNGVDGERESLFWLQFGVLALIILILVAVLWALITVSSLESGAPRTAIERNIRVLESTVAQDPENASAWAQLIRAQTTSGDTSGAKRTVERADDTLGTRRGPVAIEAARIQFVEGDHAAALDEIDAALKIVAEETEAEKKSLAERGIVMDPDYTHEISARVLKGEILTEMDDPEGAIAAYTEALEFSGRMADVLLARGLLYEEIGRIDEARADFNAALTYVPDYAPVLEALDRIGG